MLVCAWLQQMKMAEGEGGSQTVEGVGAEF